MPLQFSPEEKISPAQEKSPARHLGLAASLFLAKSAGLCGAGGQPGLRHIQPLTVAGPRPILTAFPSSLACKLKNQCKPRNPRCQSAERRRQALAISTILPIWFALFHQCAQAFLCVLKAIELIQEDAHRVLKAIAQRKTHA